ncbi:MAG: hypothetical protein WBW53_00940 [Terriglobales bacterium]
MTYSARTDNCVTGTESGCVPGASSGQAGSAMSFLLRTTDTVPFAEQATYGTAAYDPDFGSYLVLATDQTTSNTGSPYVASWHMGSDGAWDAFSQDEKLLLVQNSGGGATILYLNPVVIHAHTCTAAPSNCVIESGIYTGSGSGNLAAGGSFSFSRVPSETNILYELANPPTQINRITICRYSTDPGCSGQSRNTIIRTPYIDFTSNTYGNCDVLMGALGNGTAYNALWTGSFQIADDGSVSYGMGGGIDWVPSWTPTVNESFILPTVGNSGNKGYQATAVIGPTSGTEPVWSTCSATGSTCTDGGVTWTNIGGVGGQGPGFDYVVYRPSQGCTRVNTRLGKIYRGTGNSAPAGLMTTNESIACTRAGSGPPCSLPDRFTLHEVEQGMDGRYVTFSPTGANAANPAGSWNSGTLTCQVSSASWVGAYSATTTYTANGVVSYGGLYYTSLISANTGNEPDISPTAWGNTEAYCLNYILDTTSTLVAPCSDYSDCTGHNAAGYLRKYYGKHYVDALYSDPVINGAMNPGTKLTASLPCDDHGTYRNADTNDDQPMFTSTTDVPGWPTRYTAACYSEICAVKSDGSGGMYRFGHDWNDGSATSFQVQNAIGVVSPLGDLIAFGTDMMGTRGANTAANTTCNKLRGMYPPSSGLALNLGDTVYPVTSNTGNYIYQATVAGTTSGGSPTGGWNQTVGATQAWGTATIQNVGASNCRGDVVVTDALSAHQ